MTSNVIQSIQREYLEFIKTEEPSDRPIDINFVNDSWMELKGEISGPPNTPYEGGRFILDIILPETYPIEPPQVNFDTEIWHPNVSVTGEISLEKILKGQWAATMTLKTVLLSLRALLSAPEPDDPQTIFIANQYKENYDKYLYMAKTYTKVFAMSKSK